MSKDKGVPPTSYSSGICSCMAQVRGTAVNGTLSVWMLCLILVLRVAGSSLMCFLEYTVKRLRPMLKGCSSDERRQQPHQQVRGVPASPTARESDLHLRAALCHQSEQNQQSHSDEG